MAGLLDLDEILKKNPFVDAEELANGRDLLAHLRNWGSQKTHFKLVSPAERHRVRVDEKANRDAHMIQLRNR